MGAISKQLHARLRPLVGLPLCIARRTASMRNFHFGAIRQTAGGSWGEYALHIQCAWRVDGPGGIVTGSADLWRPVDTETEVDIDTWDYEADGNLQDAKLGELLGGYDDLTRSFLNSTGRLVVEEVQADDHGDTKLVLSGGFRLTLFPEGSRGEDWRLFQPGTDTAHLVVEGGRVVEE